MMNNIINVYAAGVLFYGKSIDQTPYFLLGRDYENKWSNFGGRCELSDKSDPDEIRDLLGMSKKTFKQAIGKLFKLKRIIIYPAHIELNN